MFIIHGFLLFFICEEAESGYDHRGDHHKVYALHQLNEGFTRPGIQAGLQELWRHRTGLECRLLLGQMRRSWETVFWQTKHRWKQTFSAHFSNVLSESVPWIRKWPLSSVLHVLSVTKEYFASVYFLPCFYVLLFIFITVINWGIVSCKERQEFLMIMYMSKGGFQSWGNAF